MHSKDCMYRFTPDVSGRFNNVGILIKNHKLSLTRYGGWYYGESISKTGNIVISAKRQGSLRKVSND